MIGAIGRWDILSHPWLTANCFGWRTVWHVLCSQRGQTFLGVLEREGRFDAAQTTGSVTHSCVGLELRAKRIYEHWAIRFARDPAAALFFSTLANQEQEHADLLRLAAIVAGEETEISRLFLPWREAFTRLDQEMRRAETASCQVATLDDALALVVEIEKSEINQLFQDVMALNPSAFVKGIRPFQTAIEAHLDFIAQGIARLQHGPPCMFKTVQQTPGEVDAPSEQIGV